jgi:uncharacterized protein (DUF885 family)
MWSRWIAWAFFLVAGCGARDAQVEAPAPPAAPTPTATAPATTPPVEPPLARQAIAGVDSPALRALVADHWDWAMREAPVWATSLGDHRFDDQLPATDLAAVARRDGARRAFLARAKAVDPSALAARDRVTLSLFTQSLEGRVGIEVCKREEWVLSANVNPLIDTSELADDHHVETLADGEHYRARLRGSARQFDVSIANLRHGLAGGRVAQTETLRRAVASFERALALPAADWKAAEPAKAAHDAWPPAERARFAAEVLRIVDAELRPAVARYRDFVRGELLPRGRAGKDEGLGALPDGAACYRARILDWLGEAHTPEELHALGLAEVAKSDAALATLGKKVLAARDRAATVRALRTDRALYFKTKEELLAAAGQDLARGRAAIPRFFGRLPKADCIVKEIPAPEAPFSTIAYYSAPHLDGTKPGEFFVNTFKPEVRPRFELATLAAHESIPGHHLQIAIAQELGDVPIFRRELGTTAFVEGWGLYVERLAEEMGLYANDLDRLGAASYDAWRSSRLVVDTGLHAMGWTRAQAEAFLLEHTALTPENVTNEVDRYIATPGQALAYKVGQLAILALRARAEKALGARFDLRGFHDAVLGGGAVTLPVLEQQVDAWIAARRGDR